MKKTACKIYAFVDPSINHSGNPCYVTRESSFAFPSITSCSISTEKISQSSQGYSLECKQNDTAIQCCGHGMLSAAYCIKNQIFTSESSTETANATNSNRKNLQLYLSMSNCVSDVTLDDEIIWLEFEEIVCDFQDPPIWLKQLDLPNQPLRYAQTAANNGYCVVQFDDNIDLKRLNAPKETIGQFTQRAIIYTSQSSSDKNTVFFRYFAPQYGNPEDTATGSAIRVLANFWKIKHQRVTLKQLSPNGGLLFAERKNKTIRVGGICRWDGNYYEE